MKLALNIVGALAVILGLVGIFVPLLPTTPFLLLASACFARGSTRLHAWLHDNRLFGHYLRNYSAGHGLPPRARAATIVLLWASIGISIAVVESPALRLLLGAIGVGVSVYILALRPKRSGLPAE